MSALNLQDDMAAQLQARMSWPQAEACAADLAMMFGRRMRDCPLTCEYCDCAPAAYLLVADLAKPAGSRATDLVCKACGEAGVRDAAQISASPSSVWLFALVPRREGRPVTTPKPVKARCPACNRTVPAPDGKTSNHGKRGVRCPGSGNPPKSNAAVMAARTEKP
ncbi:MAG TPA: hypothetical protein VGS62_06855 [Streptosporangiaceae bacterium]|nr:hypothetical protein [Streptosporangiaceae bacterium]